MDKAPIHCDISEEDLREALKEMKTYVDITEEDLKKIYVIALRHAEQRLSSRIAVRDVMTRNVIKVNVAADISEVINLLAENRISGLPVVDSENRVVGVVSEADILFMEGVNKDHTFKDIIRHLLGEPLSGHKGGRLLKEMMTSPALTVTPETDLRDVALTFNAKRIKRLPVVDSQGRLIGVISRADIVKAIGAT
jgi:CBS domain-containing membrane protein